MDKILQKTRKTKFDCAIRLMFENLSGQCFLDKYFIPINLCNAYRTTVLENINNTSNEKDNPSFPKIRYLVSNKEAIAHTPMNTCE